VLDRADLSVDVTGDVQDVDLVEQTADVHGREDRRSTLEHRRSVPGLTGRPMVSVMLGLR
jgi:hypothetical protein